MSGLTTNEINALTNQIYKKIESLLKNKRKEIKENYIPSQTYLNLESIYKEIEEYNEQISELTIKKEVLFEKALHIYNSEYNNEIYNWQSWKAIKSKIINQESNFLDEIPEKKDIKELVIIESIHNHININEFTNSIINKIISI